tara:strand:+ start:170 stop:478 length:309 start_codon:yes stop_codon:yes gene_type:complete
LATQVAIRIFTVKLKIKVMTYSELKSLNLSLEKLKQLKRNIQMLIEDTVMDEVADMRVGSKVKINHRKAPGTWTITKINRKTVIVEQDGRKVKSSMGLLVAA